jgi:acetolactate synthase-1/2/3 large subunit
MSKTAAEVPVNLPANREDPSYGSDAFVDMLREMGFDYITLTPGSTFRGIHDSLVNYGRNHKPEMILCAHEEIAVSMAHGYAKMKDKPCCVILHNLVGLQHAMMSFWNAFADRAPMVVLGGSGPMDPAERRFIDWLHCANNQSEIMRPYTKWTDEPPTQQGVINSLAKAYRMAETAPKGLSYVSIDTGLQEAKLDDGVAVPDMSLPRYADIPPVAAAEASVKAAADMLMEAKSPLILGGRCGRLAGVSEPLTELVELTGAAFQEGKDVVNLATMHPQNMTGGFGASKETEIRSEADLILIIDNQDVADMLGEYGMARGGGYGVVVVNKDGASRKVIDLSLNDLSVDNWAAIGGALPPVDLHLFADPLYGINQLLGELKSRAGGNPDWQKKAKANAAAIAERHKALRERQKGVLKDKFDDDPISVVRMIHEVYQAVKDKPYVLANRNYRSWYEGVWEFDGSNQYLGNNAGGGVGYGPGGVVGTALAARDMGRFTVAIMGDGDFTMNPAALWSAVHYKIPVLIVLHNNNSFGNDEEHQRKLAGERERPPENAWIGQKMIGPDVDFAGVARSYGANGYGPIDKPDDIAPTLKKAVADVAAGGVALVDIRTALN